MAHASRIFQKVWFFPNTTIMPFYRLERTLLEIIMFSQGPRQ